MYILIGYIVHVCFTSQLMINVFIQYNMEKRYPNGTDGNLLHVLGVMHQRIRCSIMILNGHLLLGMASLDYEVFFHMSIYKVYFRNLSALQVVWSGLGMYCWGSTVHGELGVGPPMLEQLPLPTFMDFTDSWNIIQGKAKSRILIISVSSSSIPHFPFFKG